MQIRSARPHTRPRWAVAFYRLLELPAGVVRGSRRLSGAVLGLPDSSRQLEAVAQHEGEGSVADRRGQLASSTSARPSRRSERRASRPPGSSPKTPPTPTGHGPAPVLVDPDGYWLVLRPEPSTPPATSARMGYAFGTSTRWETASSASCRQESGSRLSASTCSSIPAGIVARPALPHRAGRALPIHAGRARFALPGESRELGPGGLCRSSSTRRRRVRWTSVGDDDLVDARRGRRRTASRPRRRPRRSSRARLRANRLRG